VVVEDDWKFGGFAGELAAIVMEQAFDYLDAPVARVSGKDVPMPYNRNLEFAALPSEEDVVEAVLAMM
jgi:pyruvate dehydrogenase E1 component beta subunit